MNRGRWLLAGARAAGVLLVVLASASAAWAQQGGERRVWEPMTLGSAVVSTLLFGVIGIVMAILGFKLFDRLSPFDLEREVCEKQNMAVAILSAAMVLGICIIVAVAIL